jgi:GNAT superfamily N-acetyltransferase
VPEVNLTLTLYDGPAAAELAETVVVPLYEVTHADRLADPFYSTSRFVERLHAYAARDGFALVLARDETNHPVGQAFGYPLPAGSRWWQGLVTSVADGFTDEDGARTFALNEVMVHPDHRRQGIARTLHDALIGHRPEHRATLLVRTDNTAARAAYARWGWHTAAKLQPFPDSPVYDALILDLPLDLPQDATASPAQPCGLGPVVARLTATSVRDERQGPASPGTVESS